jgi:DNA-directed RNA polymerase sigma subunit (sigma70/sigma32)
MVQEMAPVRRQLGALGKMARRKRIFARLREGASYEEIAGEESVSRERVRQIVSEVLQKRAVDSGADHAKRQWPTGRRRGSRARIRLLVGSSGLNAPR